MADWRMRCIKCPACKREVREPVNVHQEPRKVFTSMIGPAHHVYAQQCHRCSTIGAAPALQAVYDTAWWRLMAIAKQKEAAGVT